MTTDPMTTDLTQAWSCTTCFLVCQAAGGPPRVPDVRDADGSALLARHRALLEMCSRQLLVDTAADPQRLIALAAGCRRRAEQTARWRGGAATARRRLGAPGHGRWRFALRALTPTSRYDIAAQWALGAELATEALALIPTTAPDRSTRARLLADAEATLARLDWSVFSAVHARPAPAPIGDP